MTEQIHTEITGTYREDAVVGAILTNVPFTKYREKFLVTLKIIRESSEQEYREKYNYWGPLPEEEPGKKAKFFEVIALD